MRITYYKDIMSPTAFDHIMLHKYSADRESKYQRKITHLQYIMNERELHWSIDPVNNYRLSISWKHDTYGTVENFSDTFIRAVWR